MEKYTLDPTLISLQEFYALTVSKQLIPSRVSLHEKIDERFGILRNNGFHNLGMLLKSLKSKQNVQSIADATGIPAGYLLLLRREAGSYLARPFPLSDFPGIPYEYVEVLKTKEIRNTREFFERVQTSNQQHEIAGETGIPKERLKEIFALCDLSRITGVGGVFARIVFEAGIRS
ncbi:MAG: DUF4332 domain-containing protein, partial [Bacteroidota bacterium]